MIILAPERNVVRNGSFTVKDFRLYDETSSSKGRRCVHLCLHQMIARWLLLAANVRKLLRDPCEHTMSRPKRSDPTGIYRSLLTDRNELPTGLQC